MKTRSLARYLGYYAICFVCIFNFISIENTFAVSAVRQQLPVRLRIPKININTTIEYVGLEKDAVGVPKSYTKAAWFDRGPRPGEIGSAIMTGHFGWIRGTPAVFTYISKLRPGDLLYVDTKKGGTAIFKVRETRSYDPNANAVDVFDVNDGKAHLNLITCEGVWNKITKSYSKRLVVFADKK